MKFNISSFNRIAKPLLNELAEQFPLPRQIHIQRYAAPEFDHETDIPRLKAVLHFLVNDGYLSREGSTPDNANYYLTSKGLEFLKVDFANEFHTKDSIYKSGKVGC